MGNTYVAYVIVMLLIVAVMAAMIASVNFALSIGKKFVQVRDWRYRQNVLLILACCAAVALEVFIHWITTPDT